MATTRFQLSISTPCQQSWQAMDATEMGRFCHNCQKTVVDFVGMSDQQLVAYFSATEAPVCGRFTANQLDRRLSRVPNTPGSSTIQRWVGLLAAGLISWSTAQGQTNRLPAQPVPAGEIAAFASTAKANLNVGTIDSTWVISGQVLADVDQKPLPGAYIFVKELNREAVTDTAGLFKLTLTDYPSDKLVLTISSIGFITHELTLTSTSKHQLTITLAEDAQLVGEVVYTGYGVVKKKPTLFQRLRNRFRADH